ncbi:MAG: alpha/beta hydrolase [Oscillospiraceae bacterium]|nr:alpha/beta hydrolase [Oscillospiraceae bacterium]
MKQNQIVFPKTENGIYSYEYPLINGIRQYVQIRGRDKKNPLILFLHGGPGGSLAGLCYILQREWEQYYTVVNWDQRNTCKTYFANQKQAAEIAKTGTLKDYVQDIDEIIAYLHTVYDFDKLILMGFSWGSAIGAEYAKRHPENVACYIGVGQLIQYREGVLTTCRNMLDRIPPNHADAGKVSNIMSDFPEHPVWNKELIQKLRFYSPLTVKYIAKHAKAIPIGKVLTSPFMNLKERISALIPKTALFEKSYETMLQYDFRVDMHFEMPVLFVYGEEENICPAELMNTCFNQISAPEKQIRIIPQASHCCFNDQPDVFLQAVRAFTNEWA